MYNETETIEEATVKHNCGLMLQENGEWLGNDFQWREAENILDALARQEENEVDDILESRY